MNKQQLATQTDPLLTEGGQDETPAQKVYDYELTLKFKLTSWDKPVDPELGVALGRILRAWNEGRHPFDVEMMQQGLHQCIKHAAYHVVQKALQEKHGNEVIESADGRSCTAKWYLESQKVKLDPPYINGDPSVRLTRLPGPSNMELAS